MGLGWNGWGGPRFHCRGDGVGPMFSSSLSVVASSYLVIFSKYSSTNILNVLAMHPMKSVLLPRFIASEVVCKSHCLTLNIV